MSVMKIMGIVYLFNRRSLNFLAFKIYFSNAFNFFTEYTGLPV